MSESNKGRKAVVIGAGSGMGAAVATRLHQAGYDLLIADLSMARLSDLAMKLGAEATEVDVTSDAAVDAVAKRCAGGVDALVITAGLSMSMASFDKIMDVNLGGTARVLNAFAPVMNRGGAAVCFASIAGHLAGPVDEAVQKILADVTSPELAQRTREQLLPELQVPGMAYALSKFGVQRLVQRTGVTWGPRGVRICSISPGVIDTPMGTVERKSNPEADAAIHAAPIPRLGAPEEVANVAAFLVSDQASYVTACDILVDGGWVGAIQTADENSPIAKALAAGREKS